MTPDYSTCQGITDNIAKIECMMELRAIDTLEHMDDQTTPFTLPTPTPTLNPGRGYSDRGNLTDSIPYVPSWWEGVAFEDKLILMIMLITISLIVITTLVKLLRKDKDVNSA